MNLGQQRVENIRLKELMLTEEALENNDQKVCFNYTGLPNMGYSTEIAEIYPTLFWQ